MKCLAWVELRFALRASQAKLPNAAPVAMFDFSCCLNLDNLLTQRECLGKKDVSFLPSSIILGKVFEYR